MDEFIEEAIEAVNSADREKIAEFIRSCVLVGLSDHTLSQSLMEQ